KSPECVHAVLAFAEKRDAHIAQLLKLAEGSAGLEIDYESLHLADREAFTGFIQRLAEQLHRRGQWLSVAVEPKTSDALKDKAGAIDWQAIGRYADEVKVMAYLYHSS